MRNILVPGLMAALASLTLCIGVAQAAPTQAQQDAIRASCQGDFRSYCSGVQPGGQAALQCLEKNVSKLSSACQEAVQAVSGGGASTAPAGGSAPAATTTAPATAPAAGAPAKITAPAQTTAPVSQATTVIVLQPGQEIALMRQACGADYRAHCNGVRIIGGGALQCLVSHKSSLSASCKGALGQLGQRF